MYKRTLTYINYLYKLHPRLIRRRGLHLKPETRNPVMSLENKQIMKPPNILVFTNNESTISQFESIVERLSVCLKPDYYTVYQLTSNQIENNAPWKENCALLLLISSLIPTDMTKIFEDYFEHGGVILSICSNLELSGITVISDNEIKNDTAHLKYGNEFFEVSSTTLHQLDSISNDTTKFQVIGEDANKNPLIVKIRNAKSFAIWSQIDLGLLSDNEKLQNILKDILETHFQLKTNSEETDIPKISTVYFTSKSLFQTRKLEEYIGQKERKLSLTHSTLLFQRSRNLSGSFGNTVEYDVEMLPEDESKIPHLSFDFKKYFKQLKTRRLGNSIMYGEIVNSTMDLIDGLSIDFGLVAVAKVQTGGKGRSGNKWLSPEGCAMFTYQISIPLRSQLGQKISFVQHLTTTAIVHAVRSQSDLEDLNIQIKWPNDIYFSNKSKLGGVLINSILYSDTVICYVGCGINLTNKHPTICINSIIEDHNREKGTNLKTITTEWFIASVLNCLEELIDDFQQNGPSSFLPLYYNYWLHNTQHLKLHDSEEDVIVKGLDDFGYLSVSVKGDGTKILSLQPDGNSLDMMKNLIILKS